MRSFGTREVATRCCTRTDARTMSSSPARSPKRMSKSLQRPCEVLGRVQFSKIRKPERPTVPEVPAGYIFSGVLRTEGISASNGKLIIKVCIELLPTYLHVLHFTCLINCFIILALLFTIEPVLMTLIMIFNYLASRQYIYSFYTVKR